VGRHETKVVNAAKQSDAIVRSLFPEAVADRLYDDAKKKQHEKRNAKVDEWKHDGVKDSHFETPRGKKYMRSSDEIASSLDGENSNMMGSAPIADLFPNTTVLFADLAGTQDVYQIAVLAPI
jgi:hypothetical protein